MMKLYIKEDITTKELINLIEKDNNLKDEVVSRTRNGKPYFKNSNIYFSLSDKDNVVVGVTSTRGVGIDIERFTYRPRVVKYFFNSKERELIENSKDKEYLFTKIWVKKEAILKMRGLTLESIKDIDTTKEDKFYLKKYKSYLIGYIEE